ALSLAEWMSAASASGPAIVDCHAVSADAVRPGVVDARHGRAAYTYIETAIGAALAGRVDGVVTAPIHKEALHLSGVPYPGHTEIFAALSGAKRVCMMLASEEITVSFVTTHVGLVDVSGQLSVGRVLDVIELTSGAMARVVGRDPRIAVCGLNPHAGEHGLFGKGEEQHFVEPAIAAAHSNGIDVIGPLPPDAAFLPGVRSGVDAFVAMYHDQGHIPFKMLAFDTGVNVTLGLPIVRTSVDHGTAFDIAWMGKASPNSLYQAIQWATRLASAEPL
ncbi:MAG: 4-hydroxythreonine-4-phosphate dehydrogenase PdxA, partial [Anaerolineae bacterium]|nr:4-hydroxythreonine-4-phosphate dehydrogenase PdxA [Anaerolineae bacterium]